MSRYLPGKDERRVEDANNIVSDYLKLEKTIIRMHDKLWEEFGTDLTVPKIVEKVANAEGTLRERVLDLLRFAETKDGISALLANFPATVLYAMATASYAPSMPVFKQYLETPRLVEQIRIRRDVLVSAEEDDKLPEPWNRYQTPVSDFRKRRIGEQKSDSE